MTQNSSDLSTDTAQLQNQLAHYNERIEELIESLSMVIIGQQGMIRRLLMGLFTNGHILLEGVPGLAKTLTIRTLAQVLALDFKRIQFTPDLLPADLIGTLIYNQETRSFEVKKGPVFTNIVLADEINRSPAKVQSALLEAMQEREVTIGDTSFKLEDPFLVLATQNPVDQEGTYPLPEAQVDRFMMKVHVDYPTKEEEKEIMRRMAKTSTKTVVKAVLKREDIFEIQNLIDQIQISEKIEDYIVNLVVATRNPREYDLNALDHYIDFGVSPRASLALNLGSRAYAMLEGRTYVLPEDVKAIAPDVLAHRLILSYEAAAEKVSSQDCIQRLLDKVPI